MIEISITEARQQLYHLVENVNSKNEPVVIVDSKGRKAVLIGEEDWNSIQETLYLNSIPGAAESIREGLETPIEECIPYDENEEW